MTHLDDLCIKVRYDQCMSKILRWPWSCGHMEIVGCVRRNRLGNQGRSGKNPFSMRWRLSNNRHHICPDPASGQHPNRKSHCYHFIQRLRLRGEVSPEATQLVSKWGPGMWLQRSAFHCAKGPLSLLRSEEEGVGDMAPGPGNVALQLRACFIALLTASKHSWGHFVLLGTMKRWTDQDFWSFLSTNWKHIFFCSMYSICSYWTELKKSAVFLNTISTWINTAYPFFQKASL